MTIKISGSEMIYKQIVEQICQQIQDGVLLPGNKLPTERDLARQLRVSRGTVKKAYDELASSNIIEVIQGSGSYISNNMDIDTMEERKLALKLIERTWCKLESWNLSQNEIMHLFRLTAAKRAPSSLSVPVAIIDCNPESLIIFKNQLQYIPGITISPFLIDAVLLDSNPRNLLGNFPLILTTSTHQSKLSAFLNPYNIPVVALAAAPSRQTIINISTLPKRMQVGILCQSNKFSQIIIQQLEIFSGQRTVYPTCFSSDIAQVKSFIEQNDAVIVPPDLPVLDKLTSGKVVDQLISRGKKFIIFDYQFDRGSLLHVESLVDSLVKQKIAEMP